jgi:hypothetical protein
MSTSLILHKCLTHAVAALAQYERDPRRAKPDLEALVRILTEAYSQFTPVDLTVNDVQKSRESSTKFSSFDVKRLLDEGKAQVAKIEAASKRKSVRPPGRSR